MLLSDDRKKALNNFAQKFGLNFTNTELLNKAFLHTSYIYEQNQDRIQSYERLEFLGDAVLKLIASNLLYENFENKNEGQLSEQRSTIVSDKTISQLAEKIDLGSLILTGKCEKNEGIKKESILACAFEAFLGAIYLEYKEEGFTKAKEFFLNNFKDDVLKIDYSNPKAELQEFTQKYNHNLPEYTVLSETGPAHDKTFKVGVFYEDKFIDEGEAKSKKEAEFIAAKKALDKLKNYTRNKMSENIISPSILSADFANLKDEIKEVTAHGAQWVHIDVMDGHFVPNITIGAPVVKSIRKITDAKLDVHLMIENPLKYIPDFIQAGADMVTFHIETDPLNVYRSLEILKEANVMAGIAIKPKTPAEEIIPFLEYLNMALVMTVEPGFSGQIFMPKAAQKISEVKKAYPNIKYIQVDGGINDKTAAHCKALGANCFVAGNYIFKSEDRKRAVKKLLKL